VSSSNSEVVRFLTWHGIMISLWLLRWVLVLCFDAANLACVLSLFSHKGFVHASFLTVFVPQKTALKKNGKIVQNLLENWVKNWRNCAKVACTFRGCGLQIWPGFCLGETYNNTKVVFVAVNHSTSLNEFVFRLMYFVSTTSKFHIQVVK